MENNKSEIVWLTKPKNHNDIEMWKTKPEYDETIDEWLATKYEELGSDILDDILQDLLDNGECIQVEIKRI